MKDKHCISIDPLNVFRIVEVLIDVLLNFPRDFSNSEIVYREKVESIEPEINVESKSDSSVDIDSKTEDIPEDSE